MTETAYGAWLALETEWLDELEKVYWKICLRYILMVLGGCTLALFALGVVVGGVLIGLQNAFFGFILGLIISLVCGAIFVAKAPRKCYLKSLKKEINKEFPQELEREKFAKQVLDAIQSQAVRKISWEQAGGRKGKIDVTKAYVVVFSDNGVTVVRLAQVKRMELDAYVDDISVKSEYGTVHRRQGNYIIRFFYQHTKTAPTKKETADKRLHLPSRELRDRVAEGIRAMRQGAGF